MSPIRKNPRMGLPERALTIAITGAARGIGRETARVLAAAGHRLALADIDETEVTETADELGPPARGMVLDVRERAAFAAWLDDVETSLGPLDVLINCAGIAPTAPQAVDQDPELIDRVIAVNLVGTINGTLEAVRLMLPRRRGQVINIASLAGLMGVPGLAAYSASKHGVIGFTESIRAETRGTGLDFCVVMPGPVATRMMDGTRTGPAVSLAPPERLARKIAGLVGSDRARLATPALDGALARLAGALPPAAAMRLSRLLRVDRIYTRVDPEQRATYAEWLQHPNDP